MKNKYLLPIAITAAITVITTLWLRADEPSIGQLRERLQEFQAKAESLEKQGKRDAAGAMARRAHEIKKLIAKREHAREKDGDRENPRESARDKNREGERQREGDREVKRDRPREGDRERGEANEFEQWVRQQQERIHALRERGLKDQAHRMEQQLKHALQERQAHQRHEHDKERHANNELEQWVHQQERRIAELIETGQREKAQAIRAEVEKVIIAHRKRVREKHRELEHANRAEHIAAALNHLRAAGLHEMAREIQEHLHREHRERGEHEGEHREEERPSEEEHEKLRDQVNELRRAIEQLQRRLAPRERD